MIDVKQQGSLTKHIIQFCRFLRLNKFACGIGEQRDLLQALSACFPRSTHQLNIFMRAVLVKDKDQFLAFDMLFDQYWMDRLLSEESKTKERPNHVQDHDAEKEARFQALKNWLFDGRSQTDADLAAYSPAKRLIRKDFSHYSDEELHEILPLLYKLAKRLAWKDGRRNIRSSGRNQVDMAASVRRFMRRGNELDSILFKEKKRQKMKLTLFCDVSRSMDLYSRFLIQFLFGFHQTGIRVETFVFSSELRHISHALRYRHFGRVLQNLSLLADNWSGGTRIGSSLLEFKNDYGRKYVDRDTTVIILSDGWDNGEQADLEYAMHFLEKSSRKIIWINPLMSNPDYRAETKGMQAAMPFIDKLVAVHDLQSLIAFTEVL